MMVNNINHHVSAVAGFSVALIRFAGDLPDRSASWIIICTYN